MTDTDQITVEIFHYQGAATYPFRTYHRQMTPLLTTGDQWCLEEARGKDDHFKMVFKTPEGVERFFQWALRWKSDRVYIDVGDPDSIQRRMGFQYVCPIYPSGNIGAEVNAVPERPVQDFMACYSRTGRVSLPYKTGVIVGQSERLDLFLVRVERPVRWVWVRNEGL